MTEDVIPVPERACPAAVAYDLMRDILLDDPRRPAPSSPDFRPYLLDLYSECLMAVRGKRAGSQKPASVRAGASTRQRARRQPVAATKAINPSELRQ
jgi:hypothetical protein